MTGRLLVYSLASMQTRPMSFGAAFPEYKSVASARQQFIHRLTTSIISRDTKMVKYVPQMLFLDLLALARHSFVLALLFLDQQL